MLWNALPYELKQTKGKNAFKNKLKSHNKLINDFKFIIGNISIFNKKKMTTFTFKLLSYIIICCYIFIFFKLYF